MLTVFSRNRERICWYVVNGLRALKVHTKKPGNPAKAAMDSHQLSVDNSLSREIDENSQHLYFCKEGCSFFATMEARKEYPLDSAERFRKSSFIQVQLRNVNANLKLETASAPSSAPEDLRTHSFRGRKFSAHVRVLAGQMPNLIRRRKTVWKLSQR